MHKLACFLIVASAATMAQGGTNPRAVATFESVGLYYDSPVARDGCHVRYHVAGAAEWRGYGTFRQQVSAKMCELVPVWSKYPKPLIC